MINTEMPQYTIVTLDEVPSTNSYVLENMPYLDNGTIIYTSNQTAGRGRYNRHWVCDETDNIYMSFVLKPVNIKNYPFPNLTQYLTVCVCKILERDFNLAPVIKWPNDILVNNCKISGILAETGMKNNTVQGIALGLGLNVNMGKETLEKIDQKATSLSVLTGRNYNSEKIVRNICDEFFNNYSSFVEKGFNYIKDEYLKRCFFLGKNITISENGEKREYFAQAIDDNGFLTVKDKFNNQCKIVTGDVLC